MDHRREVLAIVNHAMSSGHLGCTYPLGRVACAADTFTHNLLNMFNTDAARLNMYMDPEFVELSVRMHACILIASKH